MESKNIFALTIIALAVFFCIGAVSAGWFDFGGEKLSQTYTFDGFTLDLPESAKVNESDDQFIPIKGEGYNYTDYEIESDTQNFTVTVSEGPGLVKNIENYISNWESDGTTNEGDYGGWTVLKESSGRYRLAKFEGSTLIEIVGMDGDFLKKVADTYKKL